MLKPTSEMIWKLHAWKLLWNPDRQLLILLILQVSNILLFEVSPSNGNKGQKKSLRINVTVSDVFVLKGPVNRYTFFNDTLFFLLKLQSHIFVQKTSALYINLDIQSLDASLKKTQISQIPHLNTFKTKLALHDPWSLHFYRRRLLPQWKKWRNKGVDVLFRASFGGWHLVAKQTGQP